MWVRTLGIAIVVWMVVVCAPSAHAALWRGLDTPTSFDGITKGRSTCRHEASCKFYDDVLLVVKLNPVRVLWVDLLLHYYSTGFPNIVFFSALRRSDTEVYRPMRVGCRNTLVHFVEDNYGFCDHEVVAAASAWYPQFRGYLFLSDDVLLAFWKLTPFSKDAVWRQPSKLRGIEEMTDAERRAMTNVTAQLPSVRRVFPAGTKGFPFAATSGVYYVPRSAMHVFRSVSSVLYHHRTYNEWGTPIVLTVAEASAAAPTVFIPGKLQWGKKRFVAVKTMLRDRLWYHPVRASSETFARVTLWAHRAVELTSSTKIPVWDLYSKCMECATHPGPHVLKKGLYHSCREASAADEHRCPVLATTEQSFAAYTEAVVHLSQLPPVPATRLVGGRVVVPKGRQGIVNPFELAHEGFWGSDVTNEVYASWLPSINGTSCLAPFSMPFPQCCVSPRS